MQEFLVIPGALDRVANCMTEIQERALPGPVAFVFRDNSGFDLDIALDQRCSASARLPGRACPSDCSFRNIFASAMMACLMISANP